MSVVTDLSVRADGLGETYRGRAAWKSFFRFNPTSYPDIGSDLILCLLDGVGWKGLTLPKPYPGSMLLAFAIRLLYHAG